MPSALAPRRREFEHERNMASARALMQQGLRMCKQDETMWVEYFRMELMYVHKLRLRRKVLGLEDPGTPAPAPTLTQPIAAAAEGGRANKRRKLDGAAGQAAAAGGGGDDELFSSSSDEDEEEEGGAAAKDEDALFSGVKRAAGIVVGTEQERAEASVAAAAASAASSATDDTEQAVRAVLSGAVAGIVYRSAIAALPASVAFRQRFLDALRPFAFPGIAQLQQQVVASVERDFAAHEEGWDLRARFLCPPEVLPQPAAASGSDAPADAEPLDAIAAGKAAAARIAGSGYQQAMALYRQALQALPTARMHQLYCAFQADHVAPLVAAAALGAPGAAQLVESTSTAAAQLLASFQQAHDARAAGEPLYLMWLQWAEKLSQHKVALKAARAGCERLPSSGPLWEARLQLEQRLRGRKQHSAADLLASVSTAVAAVSKEQLPGVWLQALAGVQADGPEFQQLQDLLVRQLSGSAAGPASGGMGAVGAAFIDKALASPGGLEAARSLYRRLLKLPPAGGDLFRRAIALEKAAAAAGQQAPSGGRQEAGAARQKRPDGGSGARATLRELYEAALAAYGDRDVQLWLDYACWEQQKGVGQIYWRATKALADPEPFITAFRQLVSADDAQ